MRSVSLVLASGPGFPQGSPEHRYELSVRLDATSHMSPEHWQADGKTWPATRLWPGEAPRRGTLVHDPEGGWALHFEARPDLPGDHLLHCPIRSIPFMRPGEYLTILEPDGVEYAYRIVNVGLGAARTEAPGRDA